MKISEAFKDMWKIMLLYLHKLILPTGLLQSFLDPLHNRQHLLLLQPLSYHLYGDRQSVHPLSVVVLICSFGYTVQVFEFKCSRELIKDFINMRYWYDTARIVEL